jgi:two-component system chemotaxis response regulator CheB
MPAPALDLIVVAAGLADAGALPALLRALPSELDVPIAIVLQRPSNAPDSLAAVFRRMTARRVVTVERSGVPLRPATIYIAPSNYHLVVDPDGTLGVADGGAIHGQASSAWPLLATAAIRLGSRCAALVLPSAREDAAEGAMALEHAGGAVLRPDEEPDEERLPALLHALVGRTRPRPV